MATIDPRFQHGLTAATITVLRTGDLRRGNRQAY
jgi:hypothetical protein